MSEQALNNARVDMMLAQSDVELLEIELQQAQDNLTKAHIKAPFNGVITERFVRVGQAVSATQSVLKLVNLEQLEVKLYGPLNYGRHLEQKGSAEVFFNGGRTLLPVRALVPVSDERSQIFSAYLQIPLQTRQQFDIGQVVSVSVPSAADVAQFTVPRDALVINQAGRFVFTLDKDNIAKRIPVEVKHGNADRLAVKGALKDGERVIIRGAETLQDGTTVRVLTANEFPLAS
ncbi:MAG: efflux RND transporter periplasmic adaptor subunit [Pseudomonadota bacterium]